MTSNLSLVFTIYILLFQKYAIGKLIGNMFGGMGWRSEGIMLHDWEKLYANVRLDLDIDRRRFVFIINEGIILMFINGRAWIKRSGYVGIWERERD